MNNYLISVLQYDREYWTTSLQIKRIQVSEMLLKIENLNNEEVSGKWKQ